MSGRPYSRAKANSQKFVQLVFGSIAAFAIAMSLGFHLGLIGDALPAEDVAAVSRAFLILGAVDTIMMFVWERLFNIGE